MLFYHQCATAAYELKEVLKPMLLDPKEEMFLLKLTPDAGFAKPSYFVAVVHSRRLVVLSIRGSFEAADLLTDFVPDTEAFQDGIACKGMLDSARHLLNKEASFLRHLLTERFPSVSRSKTHEQITADDLINSVINFRVHQDADKSDVKYLGNLKKENMPPGDIPDWAYGTKVMQIREYIHKRVTERGAWHSHTLTDWSGYLGMVWKCITTADFELSFKSLVEFSAYEELTSILESHRRAVTKKYDEEFEIFERNLHNQSGILEDVKVLTSIMLDNVEETIKKQTVEVGVLPSNPRWQKWKIQETDHWIEYLHESRFHWSGRCQGSAGVLDFENVVRHYYRKLQLSIKALFKKKEIVMNREYPERFRQQVDNHFEDMFQRILQEVREKHTPMADKVPKWLTSVYASSEISQLYNLQADEGSIFQADVGFPSASYAGPSAMRKGDARGSSRLDLQDEGLQKMVDRCLADAIKYSNHIVEEVIRETKSLLSARAQQSQSGFWGTKTNQQDAHIRVKRYLTDRLCAIQQRWDAEHNVARKLEQEKDRLRCFFVDCANEVGGSEMLVRAIFNVVNPERKSRESGNIMIEAFKPILIKEFAGTLETQGWLSNAKVFRALLDLHLLNIAEGGSNKAAELLQWTANGSEHYEFIMNTLLERELITFWGSHRPWESFLKGVKIALNNAAVAAESACENSGLTNTGFNIPGLEPSRSRKAGLEHSGLKLFLSTLCDQLHSKVSKDLASAISSLSADVYDYRNLDYNFIQTSIITAMDDAAFTPHLNTAFKQEMIKGVRDRLEDWSKSGAKPRCKEACPKCQLTCYKAAKHSGLHDTLHQPKGLVGIRLKAKKHSELDSQLSCTSCSRAVSENVKWEKSEGQRSFWRSKWAKYKDFTKYFPTWATPSDAHGQCASVREYIFYNHQADIVKNFPGSNICTHIPPEYNHDPKELRIELENILKNHIKFQDSRTFI
uniref:Uncharacterized protein n=1 Tax=Physcomitrium patens TaxID=3218 RepID=A0A2K1KQJ8_PHYPA|nr:hypothetical protein PHYPA_006947 [Physcomitrium patens]